jgi:glycosyltransferase involved in cell wall biosynthesis
MITEGLVLAGEKAVLKRQTIDVVMLTKNSQRKLRDCLSSIYRNVPVNRLIVVDGDSTDNTLKILNEFQQRYGNITILKDNGTRGTARLKGIRQVKTDWFMFVDSDVVLCHNWFTKAKRFMRDGVGAVWGIELWAGMKNPKTLKAFMWITRKIFDIRGGTHDLLVRLEAVKDITIPPNLHVFEDAYIKNWIEKRGYKVIACYDPYCIHYRPENVWTFRGSVGIAADAFRFSSLQKIPEMILAYGFYVAYFLYKSFTRKTKF